VRRRFPPTCALWIDWVEWDGPLPDDGAAAASLALFGSAFDPAADREAVRLVLARFAERAFRGVRPAGDYLDRLLAIHEARRAAGAAPAEALVEPLAVILASPSFLDLDGPGSGGPPAVNAADGAPAESDRPLSDLELAARLSYFLWAAPPNVPQLSRLDGRRVSTRERLLAHQDQPQCAQCHRVIDPIGFGLENFDAAGRWRTEEHLYRLAVVMKNGPHGKVVDATFPIEPAGAFHRCPAFRDFFELRGHVAARGDDFLRGLVGALYAYALGRPASFTDADALEAIVARVKAEGGGLESIVVAIVTAPECATK
jgi:hypothetical protein